jgi:cell division septal protein FtsQ
MQQKRNHASSEDDLFKHGANEQTPEQRVLGLIFKNVAILFLVVVVIMYQMIANDTKSKKAQTNRTHTSV